MSTDPVAACPPWCVTRHGVHLGEENWVHAGEPCPVADGVLAQVVMSVDPVSGVGDGPYLLVGSREYTLSEARRLADWLLAAVEGAATTSETVSQPTPT